MPNSQQVVSISQQIISISLSAALVVSSMGLDGCKKKESAGEQNQPPASTYAAPTPDQLYQLVAPIALFPDNLVAIVLASSTFPDQITASWQWVQQNGSLKGAQLSQAVDQQPWDNSVKGLTEFPDVLQQMATNLSWTSSLGDAYFNAPKNVMNAVQVMRQKAYQAGNLKSTPQQKVQVESQPAGAEQPVAASSGAEQQVTVVQSPPQTIVIEPAQPDVVYVPSYNPTAVYGEPVPAYPGYSTGAMVTTGLVSFGVGMLVGAAISNNNNNCCGWGYNSWNTGWNNSSVNYNNNVYVSNSNTFVNNNNINRNNINANNVNRNNINPNNVNRNDLNRGNTPQFDQRRNQGVGDRNQGVGDRNQGVGNRNQGVGDRNPNHCPAGFQGGSMKSAIKVLNNT